MHKISSKRQITLPKAFCDQLNINPGDFVEIFEHNRKITIVRKEEGASKGSLQHLKSKSDITDEASLKDALAS